MGPVLQVDLVCTRCKGRVQVPVNAWLSDTSGLDRVTLHYTEQCGECGEVYDINGTFRIAQVNRELGP